MKEISNQSQIIKDTDATQEVKDKMSESIHTIQGLISPRTHDSSAIRKDEMPPLLTITNKQDETQPLDMTEIEKNQVHHEPNEMVALKGIWTEWLNVRGSTSSKDALTKSEFTTRIRYACDNGCL